MDGRYVALLDVLGFRALVAGDSAGQKIRGYLDCLRSVTTGGKVSYMVFSDSIVLTVDGGDAQAFLEIAGASSRLLWHLLEAGIALRGAIAFGDVFKSTINDNTFVAGRAVIDAYEFEQAQDWVGVMIAPSALAQVPDLDDRCRLRPYTSPADAFNREVAPRIDWAAYLQRYGGIPFRSSNPLESPRFDGFAVVPTNGDLNPVALRDSIQTALTKLGWLRALAPSPASQRKYQNSITWITDVYSLWHEAARAQVQAKTVQFD